METTPMRHFLKSLCHDLHWEYAVFWRLKHQSRMVLTWDDGYCNYPKPREFLEEMPHNVHLGEPTGAPSFGHEDNVINEFSVGYSVELAVASMSCLLYSLGEGHVGRVASTGKHCWIYADELDSKFLCQYQEELHLHFAVGIKTILLVPVMPHGVLQLGSLQKINEDSAVVAHISDMFNTFLWSLGEFTPSALNKNIPDTSSSLTPLWEKIASERGCSMLNQIQTNMKQINPLAHGDIQVTNKATHILDMNFKFIGHDNIAVQGNNTDNVWNSEIGDLPTGSSVTSLVQSQFSDVNRLKRMEPDSSSLSYRDVQFPSQWDSTEIFAARASMDMDICHFDYMIDQQSGEETETIGSLGFTNFPAESELHKAFGSALQESGSEYIWNPNVTGEDVCSSTTLFRCPEFTGNTDLSVGKSHGFFVNGGDADILLDVMISSMHDASGDISSTISNGIRSPTISSGQIAASCQTQSASKCSALGENDSGPWNSVKTGFVSQHKTVFPGSPSKSSFKGMRTNLINEERQKEAGCSQSRKSTKLSHTCQKKARHSDSQRPRPRDRQMIQDRVKQLRELIPNGAKFSIDSLLDHTIKHMLFLRSVTNRAEKLKQCLDTEAGDRRNQKPKENQGPENGASWAFDLGSQVGVCPIVVKDLDQPGHMLIEMLCEETGLFLEIAQVIRRLELTIVKGVMEYRADKSWAHFIVETSTGFRRMDIFWPLMQLLQRNSSISSII